MKYICKYNSKFKEYIKKNPHSIQLICNLKNIIIYNKNIDITNSFVYDRIFKKDNIEGEYNLPEYNSIKSITHNNLYETYDTFSNIKHNLTYLPTRELPVSVIHIGQLKLFISTLQFLLEYAPRDKVVHVIYPGSAGGFNIMILSKLFPHCKWYLYDPQPFYKSLYSNKKIVEIETTLFTDEICKRLAIKLKDKYKLLISDIRSEPLEKNIDIDNRLQEKWIRLIKPNYAQTKFRLPRLSKTYTYMKGTIYTQVFSRIESTEGRLVIDGKNIENVEYNVEEYDNNMYYFNKVLRPAYYPFVHHNNICLDHCHDCALMVDLINRYSSKYNTKNKKLIEYVINTIHDSVKRKLCEDKLDLNQYINIILDFSCS